MVKYAKLGTFNTLKAFAKAKSLDDEKPNSVDTVLSLMPFYIHTLHEATYYLFNQIENITLSTLVYTELMK